jgi:hypothetical protein
MAKYEFPLPSVTVEAGQKTNAAHPIDSMAEGKSTEKRPALMNAISPITRRPDGNLTEFQMILSGEAIRLNLSQCARKAEQRNVLLCEGFFANDLNAFTDRN